MSIYLSAIVSPFGLATPAPEWLAAIEAYDPDLRIFPSQKHPVYRLMRVARRSGGLSGKLIEGVEIHPDTKIAIDYKLVACFAIPAEAVNQSPQRIVQFLRDRDITRFGGAEKVADLLDKRDALREQKIDADNHDEGVQRHRASRIGFQYRTGSRVSLVRRGTPTPSPETPVPEPADTTPPPVASVSSL